MRTAAIVAVTILVISTVTGAVTLGAASVIAGRKEGFLLAPLEFQLNGSEPYTIGIALQDGQTISGDVNMTGHGTLSFVLGGGVIQVQQLHANNRYEFKATSSDTYQLVFESQGIALVWFDIKSP